MSQMSIYFEYVDKRKQTHRERLLAEWIRLYPG